MPNSTPGHHSSLGGKSLVNEGEFAAKFKAKAAKGGSGKTGDGPKIALAVGCIVVAVILGLWQYGVFGGKLQPGAGVADEGSTFTAPTQPQQTGGPRAGGGTTTNPIGDPSMTLPVVPAATSGGQVDLTGSRPR